jgi:microcompartment protein CcmL/EutN
LEVCGYSTALLAINKMLQECNIKIVAIDIDKPAVAELDKIPLVAQVKFVGGVDDVLAALEAGRKTALKYNSEDEVISKIITNYHEDMMGLIKVTKLRK